MKIRLCRKLHNQRRKGRYNPRLEGRITFFNRLYYDLWRHKKDIYEDLKRQGIIKVNHRITLPKPDPNSPEGLAGIGAGAIFSKRDKSEMQTGQMSKERLEKILNEPAQGFYYDGEFVPFSPNLNNL